MDGPQASFQQPKWVEMAWPPQPHSEAPIFFGILTRVSRCCILAVCFLVLMSQVLNFIQKYALQKCWGQIKNEAQDDLELKMI